MSERQGKLFSIEEFSTFDGPGIRMTVFLKGCPLRCPWCHNPEGQRFETEYMRSPNGCIGCGACERAGDIKDGKPVLTRESINACPRQLVRQSGEDITPQALAERILKNAPILKASGGGVTFSGGEPLCHTDFIADCVSHLEGLHVALQTSGYADEDTFDRALSVCDYVLYDLKIMDEDTHRRVCGVSNAPILENYRHLARCGKSFVTRIPLIPGYTDGEENLSAIATFMKQNGVTYAELLPYNSLAGAKYGSLLRTYPLEIHEPTEEDTVRAIFAKEGITVKKM